MLKISGIEVSVRQFYDVPNLYRTQQNRAHIPYFCTLADVKGGGIRPFLHDVGGICLLLQAYPDASDITDGYSIHCRWLGKVDQNQPDIIPSAMEIDIEQRAELSLEEKRTALEFALKSEALGRSERLKKLLSYICEADFEDAPERLTEYDIAVSALGRRADFSPIEDSTVRSRAYELRQKLERLYSIEAPNYPIRIDLQKGGYRPRFRRISPQPSVSNKEVQSVAQPKKFWGLAHRVAAVSFAAGVGATLLLGQLIYGHRNSAGVPNARTFSERWTPELRELWSPIVSSSKPVLLTFETRLFVAIGPEIVMRDPRIESIQKVESSPAIMDVKRLLKAPEVYEARRYSDFSVVNGVFSITNLVSTAGTPLKLQRSIDLTNEDVHDNNLILLGKPGAYVGMGGASNPVLNFQFDKSGSVRNLHPLPGEQQIYEKSGDSADSGGIVREFALITMMPGPQRDQHVLSFISHDSELFWPLGLYVTDPVYAKELVSHLRLSSGKIPDAYEVLVAVDQRNLRPVRIAYIAHRVITSSH